MENPSNPEYLSSTFTDCHNELNHRCLHWFMSYYYYFMLQKEDLEHKSDQSVLHSHKCLKKLTMILASVLLLTMFGLGGYWLGARQQRSPLPQLLITPEPSWSPSDTPLQQHSPSPATTISQTNLATFPLDVSSWSAYHSEEYGFTIKYPLRVKVEELSAGNGTQ
jgi:hypothetical protein